MNLRFPLWVEEEENSHARQYEAAAALPLSPGRGARHLGWRSSSTTTAANATDDYDERPSTLLFSLDYACARMATSLTKISTASGRKASA